MRMAMVRLNVFVIMFVIMFMNVRMGVIYPLTRGCIGNRVVWLVAAAGVTHVVGAFIR